MNKPVASRTDGKAVRMSLGTASEDVAAYVGLDRVGERFARGMTDMFEGFGVEAAKVRFLGTEALNVASWRQSHTDIALGATFQLKPFKGKMGIAFPAALVFQLVDLFFGGDGEVEAIDREFSAAENRFIARIADHTGALLRPCWAGIADVEASLASIDIDAKKLGVGRASDQLFVQRFSVSGGLLAERQVECLYLASALRHADKLQSQDEDDSPEPVDPACRDRMMMSVSQVCLPVRSILARPELPLSRIMTLQPGDVIPLTMPRSVPLTVAGRLFAHGTIGESNGRAAIRIESIQ